jgi:hypothetical protein
MVNKKDGDEVDVVQLCKGGCHDIPGILPCDFVRKRRGWEVAGTDGSGPCVLASSASLLCSINATKCYGQTIEDDGGRKIYFKNASIKMRESLNGILAIDSVSR